MQLHLKLLTVEEEDEGNVMSRKAGILIHPILDWFDDLGVYHQLILSGADVNWLSTMNISIKDRNT
jgi:hypothetical protein